MLFAVSIFPRIGVFLLFALATSHAPAAGFPPQRFICANLMLGFHSVLITDPQVRTLVRRIEEGRRNNFAGFTLEEMTAPVEAYDGQTPLQIGLRHGQFGVVQDLLTAIEDETIRHAYRRSSFPSFTRYVDALQSHNTDLPRFSVMEIGLTGVRRPQSWATPSALDTAIEVGAPLDLQRRLFEAGFRRAQPALDAGLADAMRATERARLAMEIRIDIHEKHGTQSAAMSRMQAMRATATYPEASAYYEMIPRSRYVERDTFPFSNAPCAIVNDIFSSQAGIAEFVARYQAAHREAARLGLSARATDLLAYRNTMKQLDPTAQIAFGPFGSVEDIDLDGMDSAFRRDVEPSLQELQEMRASFPPPPEADLAKLIRELELDPAVPAHARGFLGQYLKFLREHRLPQTNRVLAGYLNTLVRGYWTPERKEAFRVTLRRDEPDRDVTWFAPHQ